MHKRTIIGACIAGVFSFLGAVFSTIMSDISAEKNCEAMANKMVEGFANEMQKQIGSEGQESAEDEEA